MLPVHRKEGVPDGFSGIQGRNDVVMRFLVIVVLLKIPVQQERVFVIRKHDLVAQMVLLVEEFCAEGIDLLGFQQF